MAQSIPELQEPILPLKLPGIFLGVGLGGFFDGIFLHQLLQWHHMFSSKITVDTVQGLQMNTLGDGVFHTVTWVSVLIGLYILYSRVTESRRKVWGSSVLWAWILTGWGFFNVIEGLLDHQLLGLHHVRSGPYELWWDMGFLALGALLLAIGWQIRSKATPVTQTLAHA
jgi:uncharacterized membrane protein